MKNLKNFLAITLTVMLICFTPAGCKKTELKETINVGISDLPVNDRYPASDTARTTIMNMLNQYDALPNSQKMPIGFINNSPLTFLSISHLGKNGNEWREI